MRKLLNKELHRKDISEYNHTEKYKICVILDNVRSMNNIGSVFRTSDAFLIEKVVLCGITGCPPNNEIRKTALGAELSVPWQYFDKTEQAVSLLKNDGFTIVAVEQTENALPLKQFQLDKHQKYALIFGNEVKGVDQNVLDLCDLAIEIPQEGIKHSLNISVSVGIVLWEFYKSLS